MGIKSLRMKAGLTQVELAKKMNVDQTTISNWESGKHIPMRKLHRKLAKILNCTVDDLLKEAE